MDQREADAIVAILQPLLQAFDVLLLVARHFHPPPFAALRAQLVPQAPDPTPPLFPTGHPPPTRPLQHPPLGRRPVRHRRCELYVATYETMMAGNKNGKIVIVGKPEGSIIIDKIEGKEMPPNGAGIPDAEFVTIKKLLSERAQFDGSDAKANLHMLSAGNAASTPLVERNTATG